MSLPSSTRSATSATQTIVIHIDVEQRSNGYWHGELGNQFIHTITDAYNTPNTTTTTAAAASSSIVVFVQSFSFESRPHACPNTCAGCALLPGLSIVTVANTHNNYRAGFGACYTWNNFGANTTATGAPYRALFLWPDLLRATSRGAAGAATAAATTWLST